MFNANYSNKHSGYMGVVIAVPSAKYIVENVNVTALSQTMIRRYLPPQRSIIFRFVSQIFGLFRTMIRFPKAINCLEKALNRNNQLLSVRLQCKRSNNVFCVSNYHMPCEFLYPSVMKMHVILAASHAERFANGLPYALLGDFNITPQSQMYEILTKGVTDKTIKSYDIRVSDGDDTSDLIKDINCFNGNVSALRSAYKEILGKEPDYTNNSQVKNNARFIDTLDYIFLSKNWLVNSVMKLPSMGEVSSPMPTEHEPSDHLMISATVDLVA
jgi:hypothetical protein